MSKHYHLVVHIQKPRAVNLSIEDVVARWSTLFSLPFLAKRYADDDVLSVAELAEAIRQIELRRARLYD